MSDKNKDEDISMCECLSNIRTEFEARRLRYFQFMAGDFYIEVGYKFNKITAGYVWVSLLDSDSDSEGFVFPSSHRDRDDGGRPRFCTGLCYSDVLNKFLLIVVLFYQSHLFQICLHL